jgi:hypothetical protein
MTVDHALKAATFSVDMALTDRGTPGRKGSDQARFEKVDSRQPRKRRLAGEKRCVEMRDWARVGS